MRALRTAVALAAFLVSCGGDGDTSTVAEKRTECDKRGINPEQGRTGTCLQGGYRLTVVNRGELLDLPDWAVKLNDYSTAKTLGNGSGAVARATGTFVVFDLTATNKLDAPASFDADVAEPEEGVAPSFALSLGDTTFRQNFEAAKGPVVDSCLIKDPVVVQPGASKTCKIIFDVPSNRAANLTSRGAVGNLSAFSHVESGDFTPVGIIRLYR